MLQALIKKGRVLPVEVPAPLVSHGGVLIKVVNSCISTGTELSGVQSSGRSLIRRAMDQPENIRKVLNMARSEGISNTITKIMGTMGTCTPIGYSLAGIALSVGVGVTDICPGDPVAAAGGGVANHAEYVDVPRNLVIPIPQGASFRQASTVTLGGIAIQGVRRAQVHLGEFVVVFGAGILGQLAIQLLAASGARVIATDIDTRRLELAGEMGAELCINPRQGDVIRAVRDFTNGYGADAVLYCAATDDSQTLSDAFAMTRKKGRVVMVGEWGRELKREDIYLKEIDFLISTSYGPGRYDPNYEERGIDYPYAYVRWTENRNMDEYLRLLAAGRVKVDRLIEDSFPIQQVEQAYASLDQENRPLMVLLDYGEDLPTAFAKLGQVSERVENSLSYTPITGKRIRVGIIGVGSFATSMHLPNLKKLKDKFVIHAICNRAGFKAQAIARQYGAKYATSDYRQILDDPNIDLTMICTRHNLHGQLALESLKAGKHTFVEKPLCVTQEELDAIKSFYASNGEDQGLKRPLLMVGFNRRFSRFASEIKMHTSKRINPLIMHYRMNAGYIPLDHWVHTNEGGGRIIGEACHALDLLSFLVGRQVSSFSVASFIPSTGSLSSSDNRVVSLQYEDGSVGVLEYFAIGSEELPKENLEVHFDGKSIIVDDFKSMYTFGVRMDNIELRKPDKGQLEELETLSEYLLEEKTSWPIPLESLIETTELTFNIAQQ